MADTLPAATNITVDASMNELDTPQHRFEGYTLADIKYRRALMTLKKEFCRDKMAHDLVGVKKGLPFLAEKDSKSSGHRFTSSLGPLAGKIFSGLNYVDYAMIGFQAFKTIRKVFSIFHRKK